MFLTDTGLYGLDYKSFFYVHAHTHNICAYSEGTSIHTPACATELCCKDLYDKVADRQQQGCAPAHIAADADSVIALALCVQSLVHNLANVSAVDYWKTSGRG